VKRSLASFSLFLFGLSVVFLLFWTFFESALVGLSPFAERMAVVSLLVLPAGLGALLGGLSLVYREGQASLAVAALVANFLFALFHLLIVLWAG
jgi:hypothetical protein